MSWRDDLASLGIDTLRQIIQALLDKFLPGHATDGSPDQTELQHIMDKIKETQEARL